MGLRMCEQRRNLGVGVGGVGMKIGEASEAR